MDDVTDHGGMVNGFQWQNENAKPACFLFLDNAIFHPHIKLSNMQLAWFPPNTISVSQPKDQGIVRNVKAHYRKLLMQSLFANMDCTSSGSELARTVSVPDAVIWISQAVK